MLLWKISAGCFAFAALMKFCERLTKKENEDGQEKKAE